MFGINDLESYDKDVPFSAGRTPRDEEEKRKNATVHIKASKPLGFVQKATDLFKSMKTGASELTQSFKEENNRSRHVTFKDVLVNVNNVDANTDEFEVSRF